MMLAPTHERRAVKMIGMVFSKEGHPCGTMEFETDIPLSGFDAAMLPPMFECVEILEVVWSN